MNNTTPLYWIKNKETVHCGEPRTAFTAYQWTGNRYVFVGCFTAPGRNASDHDCVKALLETCDAQLCK